jgi:DNA transformation protein and related proteins
MSKFLFYRVSGRRTGSHFAWKRSSSGWRGFGLGPWIPGPLALLASRNDREAVDRNVALDPDVIHELFASFGPVSVRRLFGGAGLYANGVMFGLVSRGEIYLKADDETAPRFEAEGCGPFEYGSKTGRRAIASFRKLPERLYDDADELAEWARQALSVARRKAAAGPGKSRSRAQKASASQAGLRKPATGKSRTKKSGSKTPRRRRPS